MTFRELLGKYKNGSATPEEREQAEKELEKFDALTEYMLEQDFPQEEQPKTEAAEGELKKIRRNIKQRNAVLVCLAAGVACGVIAAACYFEPAISKRLWYDPTEVYNPDTEDFSTQKINSHIAVISELTMPEMRMDGVYVREQGWGRYDLTLQQWDYSRVENSYSYGVVTRNKIELRQDFFLQSCVGGIFSRSQYGFREEPSQDGIIRDVESARAVLEKLPEYIRLEAYISLSRDWDMEELAAFCEKIERREDGTWIGWTAVRTAPEDTQLFPMAGFRVIGDGWMLNEVDERYPYYEINLHKDEPVAEVLSGHFKSLLHYTIDHKDFYNKKMDYQIRDEEMLEYVEKNGVNTYGFVCYGTPQEILQVLEEPDVEGIHVSDSSISVPGL